MSAALLAFLAVVLAGLGARDQMLIAGLAARRLLPWPVVGLALATAAATAWIAALAGAALVGDLSAGARLLFAGVAATVAGVECLAIRPPRQPEEPTRSWFAHAVVLIVHQATDGARFLVFAIAVASAVPPAAALGGAAGAIATVAIGAIAGEALLGGRLLWPRRAVGVVLATIGLWLVVKTLH